MTELGRIDTLLDTCYDKREEFKQALSDMEQMIAGLKITYDFLYEVDYALRIQKMDQKGYYKETTATEEFVTMYDLIANSE